MSDIFSSMAIPRLSYLCTQPDRDHHGRITILTARRFQRWVFRTESVGGGPAPTMDYLHLIPPLKRNIHPSEARNPFGVPRWANVM